MFQQKCYRCLVLTSTLCIFGGSADARGPSVSSKCVRSKFNCSIATEKGQRVVSVRTGRRSWDVNESNIMDGNGRILAVNKKKRVEINNRTFRFFDSQEYFMAVSTSNGSAGWLPISSLRHKDDFLISRDPNWEYKPEQINIIQCYVVKNSDSSYDILDYKVVFDSISKNEKVADYASIKRKNGVYSVNLVASVPGFGLGAPAIDHFVAGSTFFQIPVDKDASLFDISARYWGSDKQGRFRIHRGNLSFYFGYFRFAHSGSHGRRFGWVSSEALVRTDCD